MKNSLIFLYVFLIVLFLFQCSQKQENEQTNDPKLLKQKPYDIIHGTGNWPSFRGEYACGAVDEQNLPIEWDGKSNKNIKWKTQIPGLAHSSPVIWEEKLFVTTAISSQKNVTFKHGLYGDGDASPDTSIHKWNIYCLNKQTGKIIWECTATKGMPKDKRHIKATYANSTPVTDGQNIIALFGSEGLFAYDVDGKFLWKKDLGRLDCGAYNDPDYEWGSASSPIIYENLVIVQCDLQEKSFIIACDIKTGETIWRVARDELPGWGTPTIFKGSERVELVTNSSNFIYGYEPLTGKELWRLGGSSKITSPTPVFHNDIIIVCSGRRPEAPIFAIKAGANGDITLQDNQTVNENIVWSKIRRGPYMPTPIIYRGYLYTLNNNGRFSCYDFETGADIYQVRIKHKGGGFSASPVASDGKIFLPSEDGEIFIIEAGPKFSQIASNNIGELLMATPAISGNMLYVRTQHHIFAIGASLR